MKTALCICALTATGLVAGHVAAADGLRDPTRPPGNAQLVPAVAGEVNSDLVLQSVLISPERRSAIINGRLLAVGDSFRGYRLAAIAETEVLLISGRDLRTLRLFPAVVMLSADAGGVAAAQKGQATPARKGRPVLTQPAADGGKN